jgi:hypothetical protein
LVPGTSNTWTDGTHTWAGSPRCNQMIGDGAGCSDTPGPLTALLCPRSPAVDQGELVAGFHCATAGGHPGEACREWYGLAPDIGACELVPPQ